MQSASSEAPDNPLVSVVSGAPDDTGLSVTRAFYSFKFLARPDIDQLKVAEDMKTSLIFVVCNS